MLQLTQHWNHSLWDRVERLVAAGVPEVPHEDRTRPVKRRRRQHQVRLSVEEMDRAVEDYLSGMSAGATAKRHGVGAQTVLNNLRARGIEPRS
ncbi:hypothetical protein ACIRN4_07000 [Pimelobacter simplex]|uniref:hypothetical protein n=1 Tax=Nocardioides simplex TaxID=2045 RepID=UPI0038029974